MIDSATPTARALWETATLGLRAHRDICQGGCTPTTLPCILGARLEAAEDQAWWAAHIEAKGLHLIPAVSFTAVAAP